MRDDELPPLRDVIRQHGLRARKSLGQNFLLDLNLTRRIARASGPLSEVDVIEIGPGPGGLTRALLSEGARHVFAVERDDRCLAAIEDIRAVYPNRLTVISGDALATDIWRLGDGPRRIVANLPYNIATPLLILWLRYAAAFDGMTLMFQREVADRLTALPGTKAYGRLSVLAQWLCEVRPAFNIPAAAFTPPPKVASTVVSLTPRNSPLAPVDQAALEAVTAAAFGQRRKMLRTSLKPLGLDLVALDIDPTMRAENLDIPAFCRLAEAYAKHHDADRQDSA